MSGYLIGFGEEIQKVSKKNSVRMLIWSAARMDNIQQRNRICSVLM